MTYSIRTRDILLLFRCVDHPNLPQALKLTAGEWKELVDHIGQCPGKERVIVDHPTFSLKRFQLLVEVAPSWDSCDPVLKAQLLNPCDILARSALASV